MQANIITTEQTINLEDVQDMVFQSPQWLKRLEQKNGHVDPIKQGKISFLIQRNNTDKPETIEMYVENGIVYVEHQVINVVTDKVKQKQS